MNEVGRLYDIFYPYFGKSGENLKRSLALFLMMAGNIVASLVMVSINTAFNSLLGALSGPGLTYSIFFGHVRTCLFVISIYASIRVFNWAMSSWLGDSLSHMLNKDLIKKWIGGKSYYGKKFVDKNKFEDVNPANVLGYDVATISSKSAKLANSFVGKIFDFCIGAYQLWYLSVPFTLNIYSLSFAIPGYMFIGAITYAIGYNLLISVFDKQLKKNSAKLSIQNDSYIGNLQHVNEFGEAIALKKGGPREEVELTHSLNQFAKIKASNRITSSILTFVQVIHYQLNYMFGLALSAPSIIAGTLESTMAFSISGYFSSIVEFFTWRKDNTESITNLNVSVDRLDAFTKVMNEWDSIHQSKALVVRKGSTLSSNDLSLYKPDGSAIFEKLSFQLPIGKATVIQGESGIGKTTLFRCLAGLWPHVKGELILPNEGKADNFSVYYIPQAPYFPYQSSLLDALVYPDTKVRPEDERRAIELMRELGFSEEIIKCVHQVDQWDKRLSGGEQQRVAIIGAILKQPDILFMDEGTSALDKATKIKAQNCLKQNLKSTTVIAIDHNPLLGAEGYKPFFDHSLTIERQQSQGDSNATISLSQVNKPVI